MTTLTARAALLLTGATLACTGTALAAPKPPVSPLPAAHTIQMQGTVSYGDSMDQLNPEETLTVRVARPNRYWIEGRPVHVPSGTPQPSVYASDGVRQYEYDGDQNRYLRGQAPKPGQLPSQHLISLYSTAFLGTVLDPRLNALAWTAGRLDGRPVWMSSHAMPTVPLQDGSLTLTYRYWEDARTGLLCRASMYETRRGKTQESIRVDFTHWVLNRPLPSARFAWAPPAGAKEYVAPPKRVLLAVGATAPDFAAVTPDGRTVHLSDLRGKTVIVDFWATWCGPCQRSMPHLESVYERVQGQDVAVLAVCVWDEKDAYAKWVQAKQGTFTFPTAFDPAGRHGAANIAGHLYGVSGIPTQFVIDKAGTVAAANVGYGDGDGRLEAALSRLGVQVAEPKKEARAGSDAVPPPTTR